LTRRLPEQVSGQGDVQQLLVELSLRTQSHSRALVLAQQAVQDHPTSSRDHLLLGAVYASLDRKPEAEAELRRAVELAERSPEPWVALVQFLAKTGLTDAAKTAIRQAEQKLPREQAALPLGLCYEYVGQSDKAEEIYRAVLQTQPEDTGALR